MSRGTGEGGGHLHSIEEFQRDVEPAIIAARNRFLTQRQIVGLFANISLDEYTPIARRSLSTDISVVSSPKRQRSYS